MRESRADGAKLTDWITKIVEKHLKTYKITEAVEAQYKGAGWALAAITGGQVVALRYLNAVANESVNEEIFEFPSAAQIPITRWLDDAAARAVVRELQALGEVSIGMCGSWEYVEL